MLKWLLVEIQMTEVMFFLKKSLIVLWFVENKDWRLGGNLGDDCNKSYLK